MCRRLGYLVPLLFAQALSAASVTWTLSNGVFSDGGTVTGSFTLDADTQTVSTWSFAVAGGDTATFPPRTYTPANSISFGTGSPIAWVFSDQTTAPSRDLRIGPFNNALSDAGGTATTVTSVFGNVECFNCGPFRTLTATLTSTPADLTVGSAHTGIFLRGQTGATYTVTVNNIQAGGPGIGTVTMVDTLPAGMTPTAVSGVGWTCGVASVTCQRADTLDGSASYPPITITVDVGSGAATNSINSVTVSGGGETNTANDTGTDPTQVNDPPDLVVSKTHPASFTRGQNGVYTLVVSNIGAGPTLSAVNVADSIPAGLTITSMTGTGWACTVAASCGRADVLGPGGSYPPVMVAVSVAATSPLSVINSAVVSGGSELNVANDVASDPTVVNPALTILTPIPNAISGIAYSQTLKATGGVAPYTWSASGQPSWLTLTAAGVLSGTPPSSFYGNISVLVTLTDSLGNSITQSVTLGVPLPALLVLQSSFTATAGAAFSGSLNAIGGLQPYTWSGTGLPTWLSISSAGQLSGTPPLYGSAGTSILSIVVNDAANETATAGLTLTVNAAPITITPQSVSPAVVGVAYQAAFSASGGSGKYNWSASGLPAGFSLTADGALSGTAPAGSSGTYSFSVTATDTNNASASVNLSLQVNPAPVVITTLANLPAGTETVPYQASLAASGGVPPYRWSGTGLPSWLALSSAGALSGTPPVGTAGTVSITALVTDSSKQTAQATFQIAISPANSILGIDTNGQLPPATVGLSYTVVLSAHGGKPPYLWSENAVAPGLSLSSSGVVSGTPTAAQAATFTGQVSDAAGASAFRQFNLNIVSAALSIQTPTTLAAGQIGVPYMQLLSATGSGQQLIWSLASGSLPQGVTLNPNGTLLGTPQNVGTFSFTVSVSVAGAPANQTSTTQTFQIQVLPSGAGLIFSAATLPFFAVTGASNPQGQAVSIISTAPAPVPFTVTTSVPWVAVTPATGTTPGNVVVSVDQTGLAPGAYSTSIGFATPGNPPQLLSVTLDVSSSTPSLAASPDSVRISSLAGSSTPLTGPIFVQNTGPGYLSFTATVLDAPWLSVNQAGGVIAPNQTDTLTFSANTVALTPGVYRGRIELGSDNGFADIPVTLTVTAQNRMTLSSSGTLLQARQGEGISGPATQSFTILAAENTPLNWTAQLAASSNFLTLSATSGVSTSATPGSVSYQVNSSGLAVGSYYARIEITSPDAVNSPQEFVVVLNVVPAAIPATPSPSPAGLLFVSSANGAADQNVTVFTSSSAPIPFQASASTDTGSPWLSVTPLAGSISSQSPAQLTVSVSPAGLAAGVYRGTINVAQGNLAVPGVNVTLIVAIPVESANATATAKVLGCTPASLVMTYTGLTNEFSTPASWPGAIVIALADNCGGAVTNGDVVASFSNGDAPIQLSLSDPVSGSYSATWVPQHSGSQVSINAQATATGLAPATASLIGTVAPNLAPVINKNGIVNGLNPQVGAALAPGTIVQIYGSGLAASAATPSQVPLPTTIQGTSVLIGGLPAPLYYISDSQINAQIPFELAPGHEYPVIVTAGSSYTVPQTIELAPLAPGVARLPDGSVIAQHSDFTLVTDSSPAQPGEYLVAYLVGMGLTDVQVPDGSASPSSPLASVAVAPGVTLNGEAVHVAFAGLTPGGVGLYQINFQVPADAASGDLVLQVAQQGALANAGTIAVAK